MTTTIARVVREELVARFVRYAQIDTQSAYGTDCYPSTTKQLDLLRLLRDELLELGISDAEMDEHGYVMGTIPASSGYEAEPTIGLIAHVDTSPDMSGANVRPQMVYGYDGGDIALGTSGYVLSPREFPELKQFVGHDLITTDGTTLLGADDKAGVAEIMTLASYLMAHPEIQHGRIRIAFTADEEVGAGVDHFDVARFGADFAYTMDGSQEGELEYECFNAASADITAIGRNVHPGYAKGKMINALQLLHDLHTQLPTQARPERTEGYEGFYHLTQLTGTVEQAQAHYIIRDHDRTLFEEKKDLLTSLVRQTNEGYGTEVLRLKLDDQYYNMRERIEPHMEIVDRAAQAMRSTGITPLIRPIRGGTDGARLSYMGLPCPNIFAGGMNFHGRYEYTSIDTMTRAVEMLVYLVMPRAPHEVQSPHPTSSSND